MSCRCDLQVFPPPLVIPPGLVRIERQIAGFPQWRQALLAGAGNARHAATLGAWKASGPNDLGLMLIEMWAYLADVLAFYDEVHAHECYLRTARLPESVRMLVERLACGWMVAGASVSNTCGFSLPKAVERNAVPTGIDSVVRPSASKASSTLAATAGRAR